MCEIESSHGGRLPERRRHHPLMERRVAAAVLTNDILGQRTRATKCMTGVSERGRLATWYGANQENGARRGKTRTGQEVGERTKYAVSSEGEGEEEIVS